MKNERELLLRDHREITSDFRSVAQVSECISTSMHGILLSIVHDPIESVPGLAGQYALHERRPKQNRY